MRPSLIRLGNREFEQVGANHSVDATLLVEGDFKRPALLLEAAKVAIVPGEAFGAPGHARLSFALGDDDLGVGVRRIAELLS